MPIVKRKKTVSSIPSGNKTRAGADEFVDRGHRVRVPGLKPAGGNATTGEYPIPIAAPDKEDVDIDLLGAVRGAASIYNQNGGNPAANMAQALTHAPLMRLVPDINLRKAVITAALEGTQLDAKDLSAYVGKKAREVEYSQFQAFAATKFNLQDPYQLELYNKLFPEAYEQKMKVIDQAYAVEAKIHEINLTGLHSRDDVEFLWRVYRGELIPASKLFGGNIPGLAADFETANWRQDQNGYVSGWFSPLGGFYQRFDGMLQKTNMLGDAAVRGNVFSNIANPENATGYGTAQSYFGQVPYAPATNVRQRATPAFNLLGADITAAAGADDAARAQYAARGANAGLAGLFLP